MADQDSDVTNDTTAKPDRGVIDWDPKTQIPFAAEGNAIYTSGKDFAEGKANAADIANVGLSVASMAQTGMDIASDPLNWLISKGLGFLIDWFQPLEDALGLVTGNPERMGDEIVKWERVANALGPLSQEIRDSANAGLTTWEGKAGTAAKTRLNEFADGVAGTADGIGHLMMILNITKMLMEFAQAFVLSIISTFVQWMIMTWIPALAAAVPTCGASTAAAGAATGVTAATTTSRTARFVQKVKDILLKIKQLLTKFKDYAITKQVGKFNYVKDAPGVPGGKVFKMETLGEALSKVKPFDPTRAGNWNKIFQTADKATQNATDYGGDEDIDHDLDPNR